MILEAYWAVLLLLLVIYTQLRCMIDDVGTGAIDAGSSGQRMLETAMAQRAADPIVLKARSPQASSQCTMKYLNCSSSHLSEMNLSSCDFA